ncbi:MAG: class I SAM-dependent methyltransferase [Actinomyces sp.]|jgi:SAM-dependent methyltransferase|nr:class I SAM-dependent methyltransferase [Actinomyces sp.]MCI1642266.1 class I SAM-dependent methyltransferase [Actinomyces sp.]MCI1662802.1 class I SAM-dependent methyltransferase [Actinomyces sp.]MCI1691405.1 class I SAM-dependent methyltransferase [Actinomyces sp.]MCI1788125.1 class I SAM-dependent methyltransferase [Actinomyces sp.]MCI1830272.1 class I SAM-dependent methyltransferase [Actinomyces sp.]
MSDDQHRELAPDGACSRALGDNRANWDDRAEVHAASRFYDVDGFVADPHRISDVVRRDLAVLSPHLPGGSVRGASLLHLQCHIGTDTVSWWRLGARDVHGLDFSPNSLRHARGIAARAGAAPGTITFVEGDARFASRVIRRRFDVVVTSTGTIVWLPGLREWARSIAELLEPGGVFMIRDDHPLLGALDYSSLTITEDYLSGGGENVYEAPGSYTDGPATIAHTTNHEWRHDLSEVVTALRDAGLAIEALGEHPVMDWAPIEGMVATPDGWALPEGSPRIPLTFSVVARRPD